MCLCGMHGKPSQNQNVSGRVELPTSVCVTRRAAGVFVAVLTVCDTNQMVIPPAQRVWAGEVSVACSVFSVGCALTFLVSCRVSSTLWHLAFLTETGFLSVPLEILQSTPFLQRFHVLHLLLWISWFLITAFLSSVCSAYPSWVSLHRKY